MAISGKLASLAKLFGASQKGTTAVMFALSAVPLVLSAGVAVDYVRYTAATTELQSALDAGALAAAVAKNLNHSARIAAAQQTFAMNLKNGIIGGLDVDADFKISGTSVSASASLPLPSAFMQVAGIDAMAISAETEITVPEDKKAEIALVLDYSGSMTEVSGGKVKYVAMKTAASKLVSDLQKANPKNVKFGLVPFSHHVYVTLPKAHVLGQTGAGTWTGCTQDRKYPYNLSGGTPGAGGDSKWGQPIAKVHASDGCGAYVPNNLKVMPLTGDFAAVTGQLAAMKPYAWTHIALGAEFGFHLLSPDAPFTEGAAYSDTKTKKVMVLLTDGRQTEPAFGAGTVRSVQQGEKNLAAICGNAKAEGIVIMTVAFDLEDEGTKDRLRNCATDPAKHFFIAEDDADIAKAFEEIRNEITAQVFISK